MEQGLKDKTLTLDNARLIYKAFYVILDKDIFVNNHQN